MIHTVDPRQNRFFDPFHGVIPPAGRKIVGEGWQGVFRHVLLELMPVDELGQHFSDCLGAPTKELYSMAGLVFLTAEKKEGQEPNSGGPSLWRQLSETT